MTKPFPDKRQMKKVIDNFKSNMKMVEHNPPSLDPCIMAVFNLVTTPELDLKTPNWSYLPKSQGFWRQYNVFNKPEKISREGDLMTSIVGVNPYNYPITLQIISENDDVLEIYVLPSGIFTIEFVYPLCASLYTHIFFNCSHNITVNVRQECLSNEDMILVIKTSYLIKTSTDVFVVNYGTLWPSERYLEALN